MHYWYGCIDAPNSEYPSFVKKFTALTDKIKIVRDLGNQIPDKSWMLYLLEVFNTQKIPVELNLICQFDSQNYFEAIFRGHNQYRFRKIIPEVGGIYKREIKFHEKDSKIEYHLQDLLSDSYEVFSLSVDKRAFVYQFHQSFTGTEWWNRIENCPYPIRFEVTVSNLMYYYNDNPSDPDSLIFFPIGNIYENKYGTSRKYPVQLTHMNRIEDCICYSIR